MLLFSIIPELVWRRGGGRVSGKFGVAWFFGGVEGYSEGSLRDFRE